MFHTISPLAHFFIDNIWDYFVITKQSICHLSLFFQNLPNHLSVRVEQNAWFSIGRDVSKVKLFVSLCSYPSRRSMRGPERMRIGGGLKNNGKNIIKWLKYRCEVQMLGVYCVGSSSIR